MVLIFDFRLHSDRKKKTEHLDNRLDRPHQVKRCLKGLQAYADNACPDQTAHTQSDQGLLCTLTELL